MSASQIKIMEPGAVGVSADPTPAAGEGERLVVITGQPANIQMAVQLLYHVSSNSKYTSVIVADDFSTAFGAREAKAASCSINLTIKPDSC